MKKKSASVMVSAKARLINMSGLLAEKPNRWYRNYFFIFMENGFWNSGSQHRIPRT